MNDDKAYSDYIRTLADLPLTVTQKRRIKLNMTAVRVPVSFRPECHCRACTDPTFTEVYVAVKDYKVVEGIRQRLCSRLAVTFGLEAVRSSLISGMGLPPNMIGAK